MGSTRRPKNGFAKRCARSYAPKSVLPPSSPKNRCLPSTRTPWRSFIRRSTRGLVSRRWRLRPSAPRCSSRPGQSRRAPGTRGDRAPAPRFGAWVGVCRQLVAQRGELTIPDQGSRGWAKGFSWDVCAERHFEIYRKAADVAIEDTTGMPRSRDALACTLNVLSSRTPL